MPLDTNMGLLTVATSDNPVSMIAKNEVEGLFYVKLDILGLDNVGIINEACKLANIERLTPDNVPDDEKVWMSIKENTLGIFQWESEMASKYLENLFSEETLRRIREINPDFKYIDLFSVGNGAIRPAGASYRDLLANGIFRDNGHEALNNFLASTLGYLVYQEQIIEFLHSFCGFTMGEADIVRRAFAKKTGTEIYIPKIKDGFTKTMFDKYNVPEEKSEELIVNFLQVIIDASDYLFSLNHSQAYSYIGYMCGYLRYYYPLEFLTAMLNINNSNLEKTTKIINYAKEKDINIEPPTFGKSKAKYFFDKDTNTIYKGIESIKYLNEDIADYLYDISKENYPSSFTNLLFNINKKVNNRQIEVLIKIGYFRMYGPVKRLLEILNIFKTYAGKKQFSKTHELRDILVNYAAKETEKMFREVNTELLIEDLASRIPDSEYPISQLAKFQLEFIGSIDIIDPLTDNGNCIVMEVDTKYTPSVKLYKLRTGEIVEVKVKKDFYYDKPLKEGDSLYVASCEKKARRKKIDDKWVLTDEYLLYITYFVNINM